MTAQFLLREEAAELDRVDERLTSEIEDLEKKIVAARERRATLRFHRAEFIAAAQVLDGVGFRVDREPVLTVHVDQHIPITPEGGPELDAEELHPAAEWNAGGSA